MVSDPSFPHDRLVVKVCGIRTPEDLTAAEGADLIGVVIDVPGSPRTRSVEQARGLFRRAEGRFRRAAVLVDPSEEQVREVLEAAAPDLVQIHGPLPLGLRREELTRVIPSIGVPRERGPGWVPQIPFRPDVHPFVHLDALGSARPGGTGTSPDWELCRALVLSYPSVRFLLGGGLTPDNLARALGAVRPAGVDVASGVESRPGEKSRVKVERFLQVAREYRTSRPGP